MCCLSAGSVARALPPALPVPVACGSAFQWWTCPGSVPHRWGLSTPWPQLHSWLGPSPAMLYSSCPPTLALLGFACCLVSVGQGCDALTASVFGIVVALPFLPARFACLCGAVFTPFSLAMLPLSSLEPRGPWGPIVCPRELAPLRLFRGLLLSWRVHGSGTGRLFSRVLCCLRAVFFSSVSLSCSAPFDRAPCLPCVASAPLYAGLWRGLSDLYLGSFS